MGFVAFASTILAQLPGTFTATGSMTTARYGHTATLLTSGKVLIAGGTQQRFPPAQVSVILASAELYDPSSGTFTATGDMTTPRLWHGATLLPDGKVLITGGRGGVPYANGLDSAEVYDPSTGTFAATGRMTTAWSYHTATLLNDGKVLIAGGTEFSGLPGGAELYDPSAGTFAATGSTTQSPGPTTLLTNGTVLIAGLDAYGFHTAELFNPATGMFGLAGRGTVRNHEPATSTLLTNGTVLDTLYDSCDPGNGAELYDPSLGTLTTTGSMIGYRWTRSTTLLPDGTVLVAGGSASYPNFGQRDSNTARSAELYQPSNGTFSPTGSMTVGRDANSATLLPDGAVLIVGGLGYQSDLTSTLASAELYHPAVLVPAPALLSLSGDGRGQGAIQHAGTYRIASADDAAVAGEYLSIYLHGLADGSVIPPRVAIGGRLAEITFFGNVPGYPGLNLVNIRMPGGVAPGPAVPVRLTYLDRPSNEVTIGVAEASWQDAIAAMKGAARTDSLNFWQWAWYWQYLPAFSGAPAGFGVGGSISPDVMAKITTAGGGDPLRNISAEQWVAYFRQVVPR